MITGFGSVLKDYLEYHNISQVEFAESLDITPKHLNEILNKNIDMSEELMVAISLITDIDISLIVNMENEKKMKIYLNKEYGDNLSDFLKQFNINELSKKHWIEFKNKDDTYRLALDLLAFLKVRNFKAMDNILANIMYKKKDDADKIKTLLWISRCNELALKQTVNNFEMNNFNIILDYLKEERNKPFNYQRLQSTFNKYGFYFVIEDSLSGTKVRGCSKVKNDKPAIYLTKLFNDKASLYFAMYHEIGHLKQNYNKSKRKYIIDEDIELENKADKFALNQMIDEDLWSQLINSSDIKKTSIEINKKYNIPLCFIVRNLAYNKYIKYTDKFYLDNIEKIN